MSTEGRRSGAMDAQSDVGANGNALDGDALGAFDALDARDGDGDGLDGDGDGFDGDGDGFDGDGLDRDACPCGEEGRATTIVARRTRRSTVTAWSGRVCGRTHALACEARAVGPWSGAVGAGARRHAGRG